MFTIVLKSIYFANGELLHHSWAESISCCVILPKSTPFLSNSNKEERPPLLGLLVFSGSTTFWISSFCVSVGIESIFFLSANIFSIFAVVAIKIACCLRLKGSPFK